MQREHRAEGEVHPELRALGHCPPDDRQRDRGERDLEQVAGRSRDRAEPRERRLPDREQFVDRREEARASDEAVAAVAERNPEADQVVDDRRDAEDEHVLGRDVADVLHPRESGLEKRESGLHEDDEDRREDHPDRAGGESELSEAHTASTSSKLAPGPVVRRPDRSATPSRCRRLPLTRAGRIHDRADHALGDRRPAR